MANAPLTFPGNLGNPASFDYAVAYRSAPGAFTERIVSADPAVGQSYAATAAELADAGLPAVITTCGFNIIYQDMLADALPIPIATSSLLLLPLALRLTPGRRRVAVLTYDARQLDERFLAAAGIAPAERDRLVIEGLEGTDTWLQLAQPAPALELHVLAADVMAVIDRLLTRAPDIGALFFECSALCPFSPKVRAATGLPVYDFLTLADLLHTVVADTRPFTADGRAATGGQA